MEWTIWNPFEISSIGFGQRCQENRELFSCARNLKEINSELVPGLGFGWVLKSVDELPGIFPDFKDPLFKNMECL